MMGVVSVVILRAITLHIVKLSAAMLYVMLHVACRYAECCMLTVMLHVVMVSVVMLNVMAPSQSNLKQNNI
jgi:hypothetical protein